MSSPAIPAHLYIPYADIHFGSQIGTGGFATVFGGTLRSTGQPVAIKKFNPVADTSPGHPTSRELCETECRTMMTLHHPNVVRVLGVSEDPATRQGLLLTELAEGTLADTIRDPSTPWPAVVALLVQITEGLHYLHTMALLHLLHLDLKPTNVLRQGAVLKLCDFGISKVTANTQTTRGAGAGTAAYMAPEQYDAEDSVSVRTDVYALGVLFFEFITKTAPWAGLSHAKVMKLLLGTRKDPPTPLAVPATAGCPPALIALVTQCLCIDPSQRPASMAAVLLVLRGIVFPTTMSPWTEDEPTALPGCVLHVVLPTPLTLEAVCRHLDGLPYTIKTVDMKASFPLIEAEIRSCVAAGRTHPGTDPLHAVTIALWTSECVYRPVNTACSSS